MPLNDRYAFHTGQPLMLPSELILRKDTDAQVPIFAPCAGVVARPSVHFSVQFQ